MRILVSLLLCVLFFSACDLNKYTNVYIENKNDYPINVKIVTNNIESEYRVEANSDHEELRKWTDIDLEDGAWEVTINNANTGKGKTFEHGHFYKGELTTTFIIRNEGGRVEFEAND